jgi:ASC-1-like (ASCH) protein
MPWYDFISMGMKTVEGRLNKGDFLNIQIGDIITFTNEGHPDVTKMIVDIRYYQSFHDMLEHEGLNHVLPGIDSIDHGVYIYEQYYPPSEQALHGVVAIQLE